MKAIDLLGGHASDCSLQLGGSAPDSDYCTCRLSSRQQAARDIDARVEALADAVELLLDFPAHDDRCAVFAPGPHDCSCGLDAVIDTARALLTPPLGVPRG